MKKLLKNTINKHPDQYNLKHNSKMNDCTIFTVCMMAFFSCTVLNLFQMRDIDYSIENFLNLFADRSKFINAILISLTYDGMTVAILMAAIFYEWFNDKRYNDRKSILTGTIISFFSGVLSRLVQLTIPSHLRPLHDPNLHLVTPYWIDPNSFNHWASFPRAC